MRHCLKKAQHLSHTQVCANRAALQGPNVCPHSQRWQASPSYPTKHLHLPDVLSHSPALLHSARAWAV